MNPALMTFGNTRTHSAFSSRSRGIPLSGVPMISLNTLADFAAWLAPSLVFGTRIRGSGVVVGVATAVVFGFDFDLLFLVCELTARTAPVKRQTPSVQYTIALLTISFLLSAARAATLNRVRAEPPDSRLVPRFGRDYP